MAKQAKTIKLTCICGFEEEIDRKDLRHTEWSVAGTKWICPDCQKNPDKLLKKTGGSEPEVKVEEIIADEEEKIKGIEELYKTKDGKLHKTLDAANKHIDKMLIREKVNKLINDPIIFNDEKIDLIIDNIEALYEVLKGE